MTPDQSDGSEYYEPQEIPVGSRVRVNVSPECPGVVQLGVDNQSLRCDHTWANGHTGRVYERLDPHSLRITKAHPYLVLLDEPAEWHAGMTTHHAQCAGLELEIIA